MASQYDKLFNTNYVSQYVPLPLEFIAKAGAMKQGEYDSAIDQAAKVEDELLKVNAIDQHQPFKQQLINSYKNKVEGIADEIVRTGDTSKARELKRIANQWQNDPLRNELENSYSQYGLDTKSILDTNDKGLYNENIYNPRKGFQGNINGQIEPYRAKGVKPIQDYIPAMDKAIDGLKSDSTAFSGYKKVNGKLYVNENNQLVKENGEREELTSTKLASIASLVAPTFFQSPTSQYYIDEKFGKSMPPFNQLPKDIQSELINHVTSDIIRRGSTQLFTKDKSGIDLQNLPEGTLDNNKNIIYGEGKLPESVGVHNTSKLNNSLNNLGMSSYEYDNDSNFKLRNDTSIWDNEKFSYKNGTYTLKELKTKYPNLKINTTSNFSGIDLNVTDEDGVKIPTLTKGKIDVETAFKQIAPIASRLNIKYDPSKDKGYSDFEKRVGESIKRFETANSNYTILPASDMNNLSDYYQIKINDNNEITDPGSISMISLKDVSGVLITDSTKKQEILKGANLKGVAKSIDSKTEAGDILTQAKDGKIYYLNTNNETFNNACKPAQKIYASIGNYIKTGKEFTGLEKAQSNDIKNQISQKMVERYFEITSQSVSLSGSDIKITDIQTKDNIDYITILVPKLNDNGKFEGLEPKTAIADENGNIDIYDIGQAATQLDNKLLPNSLKLYKKR